MLIRTDTGVIEMDHLESEIECLCLAAERCRTLITMGRIAVLSGAAVLVLMFASVFRFDPTAFGLAVAALLGGVPLKMSSSRTLARNLEAYRANEARRAEVIDRLGLRSSPEEASTGCLTK
jgi:hypothetical protein